VIEGLVGSGGERSDRLGGLVGEPSVFGLDFGHCAGTPVEGLGELFGKDLFLLFSPLADVHDFVVVAEGSELVVPCGLGDG
jgi:hypothetical protein